MEDKKEKNGKKTCDCPCCNGMMGGHGTWHGFVILRVLLGLIVVVTAFWVGIKLGEMKQAYYDVGYTGGYGNYRMMTRGYPMMGGGYGMMPTTQTAPSAGASTTK